MTISYVLSRVRSFDAQGMGRSVSRIARETGRNPLMILGDMAWCWGRYGAGWADYLTFGFCSLPDSRRQTYLTREGNNRLVRRLNRPEDRPVFEDKVRFYEAFALLVRRKWIELEACGEGGFKAFLAFHDRVMVKPRRGMCGEGVQRLTCRGLDRARLLEKGVGLMEEVICQHSALEALYPHSVNTLRIITLVDEQGGVHAPFASLRIGSGGSVADNLHKGGMAAAVDLSSGTVVCPAEDRNGKTYRRHPETGALIEGFVIPHFDRALELARQAARVVPGIRYVGWDIAICPQGVELVEGNHYPGNDIFQLPSQVRDGQGMLPVLNGILTGHSI